LASLAGVAATAADVRTTLSKSIVYSQPFCCAICTASARFLAPSFWMAADR
jgi:hypothetical protein